MYWMLIILSFCTTDKIISIFGYIIYLSFPMEQLLREQGIFSAEIVHFYIYIPRWQQIHACVSPIYHKLLKPPFSFLVTKKSFHKYLNLCPGRLTKHIIIHQIFSFSITFCQPTNPSAHWNISSPGLGTSICIYYIGMYGIITDYNRFFG